MSLRAAPDDLDQIPSDEAFSLIDRHTTVDGMLATDRDLRVDGRVLGSLRCGGVLFVAEGAAIDAEVDAAGIVVSGSLAGTVVCRGRLEIRATGVVRAAVQTAALVILEGALYEGELTMQAPEPRADAGSEPEPEAADAVPATEPDEPPNAYSFLRRFTTTRVDGESTSDEDLPGSREPERHER